MLEKFDPNKKCPKCSFTNSKVSWIDTLEKRINPFKSLAHFGVNIMDQIDPSIPAEEHLQVSCKRCGFVWYTATDDQVDNQITSPMSAAIKYRKTLNPEE